jgi:hypothetical protein
VFLNGERNRQTVKSKKAAKKFAAFSFILYSVLLNSLRTCANSASDFMPTNPDVFRF